MDTARNLVNPFPGLRPFEADEAHLFFGRDSQSSEIIARLQQRRFVAVVGTSGSGKSSLVRAGLLPLLEGGFMADAGSLWRIAVMRPGADPIAQLAKALSSPDVLGDASVAQPIRTALLEAVLRRSALGLADAFEQSGLANAENLLVLVDQFEEVFRFDQQGESDAMADGAAGFVNLLLEAVGGAHPGLYVVLTMRSDFLGDCARFRGLPELLNDGQYLIPRLTRDQRRATIEGPVLVGGASIAPRLTQRLLNDAGEDPDILPVLQHALMRTWDAWHAQGDPLAPLDLAHYEAVGTIRHALSRHADHAYERLAGTPGAQSLAQTLFRALCNDGADRLETRRPATLASLAAIADCAPEQMADVVDAFRTDGCTFLTPGWPTPLAPDTVIDISHESLIRQWQRLRAWVQQEAQSRSLYQRLAQTAQLWPDSAALWRNPDLERALTWASEEKPTRHWARRYGTEAAFTRAMEFLNASEAAWRDDQERQARQARDAIEHDLALRTQQDREARLNAEVAALRLQKQLSKALWLLIPALLLGMGWAFWEAGRARTEQARAQAAAEQARIEARNAREARDASREATADKLRYLQKLTNTNPLKQAFLTGDADAIRRFARDEPPNPDLQFSASRDLSNYADQRNQRVWRYDLYPKQVSLDGKLRLAAQISYFMDDDTLDAKLLSAGAGTRFRASYTGTRCLTEVFVLVEYANPDSPPKLVSFDQCAQIAAKRP